MPNKPQIVDVSVDSKSTAFLVLDLNARCEDPNERCHQLIEPVAKFLARAREKKMLIVYTAADRYKGTPLARMPHAFNQQPDEPVLFPAAFDKFYGGDLQPPLPQRGMEKVGFVGGSSNHAGGVTAPPAGWA